MHVMWCTDKMSQDERSQGQNVPREKTSYTVFTKFSKTTFVLKNLQHTVPVC